MKRLRRRIKQFYSEDLSPKPDAVEKPTAAADGVFIHPPLVISSSYVGSVWKCKIQNIPFSACQMNRLNFKHYLRS